MELGPMQILSKIGHLTFQNMKMSRYTIGHLAQLLLHQKKYTKECVGSKLNSIKKNTKLKYKN